MISVITVGCFRGRQWGVDFYTHKEISFEHIKHIQHPWRIVLMSAGTDHNSKIPACFTHTFRQGRFRYFGTIGMLTAVKSHVGGTPIKRRSCVNYN